MNKPAPTALRQPAQGGFTLIELIVVIVILGILAATALPKFASLGGDARAASVRAALGAVNTTVSMVHGQALLNPSLGTVTNEGVVVGITNGYPSGTAATAAAAGLADTDYVVTASVAGAGATGTLPAIPVNGFVVVPRGISGTATALTCFISYAASTAANVPPAVNIDVSNCGS